MHGTSWESYAHDGLGRVKTAQDDDSTVTRRYDSLGNVVRETIGSAVTVTVHDGLGLLKRLEYPGGRVIERVHDGANRLAQVKSGAGVVLAEWDWLGPRRLDRRRTPQNQSALLEMSWDTARRPTGVAHSFSSQGGGAIETRLSEWDRVGNRVVREDPLRGIEHEYVHDSAYRMVESTRTGGGLATATVSYALDGVGNRASVTGGADAGSYVLLATSPPADHQVNQYSETPFDEREYDPSGNLTTLVPAGSPSSEVTVLYDFKDRMVEWQDAGSAQVHAYAYDALGRRISKTVDATGQSPVMTRYRYHGWRIVEEQDAAGLTLATYVYGVGLDELVSMGRDGRQYYVHQDDLGNVYALSTAQLGVVERYEYQDYGVVVDPDTFQALGTSGPISASGNPVFFAGARLDEETGLYWMRHRYMDPRAGRFVTRDPLGVWGDAVNLGNGSAYAGNNPWTLSDPSGREVSGIGQYGRPHQDLMKNSHTYGSAFGAMEQCSHRHQFGPQFTLNPGAGGTTRIGWRGFANGDLAENDPSLEPGEAYLTGDTEARLDSSRSHEEQISDLAHEVGHSAEACSTADSKSILRGDALDHIVRSRYPPGSHRDSRGEVRAKKFTGLVMKERKCSKRRTWSDQRMLETLRRKAS